MTCYSLFAAVDDGFVFQYLTDFSIATHKCIYLHTVINVYSKKSLFRYIYLGLLEICNSFALHICLWNTLNESGSSNLWFEAQFTDIKCFYNSIFFNEMQSKCYFLELRGCFYINVKHDVLLKLNDSKQKIFTVLVQLGSSKE